ncbi:hypothetical protein RchiOBHm_Chr1g0363731 [Rosa chinensis]|uniref:Uncharacterized protein n=1 Tax=Rosa chinensis TaxID=74649 RepID=A0A2P6SJJ4_ROSCH|nr:hypothetical protein RchiOBHm_Chr1g0363731 [Rosa chinensis]
MWKAKEEGDHIAPEMVTSLWLNGKWYYSTIQPNAVRSSKKMVCQRQSSATTWASNSSFCEWAYR